MLNLKLCPMIKSLNLRFDKFIHATEKAYLLKYQNQEVWIPKKLAWNFQVAGNDLHAWATIPAWLFEKITGQNPDELLNDIGTFGMKENYGAIPQTIVEKHVPDRKEPVENNFISELKK